MEKHQVSINRDWLSRVDQFDVALVEVLLTVTNDIRSASWRCATAVRRKNIDNTPANSMAGLKSGLEDKLPQRAKGKARTRPSSATWKGEEDVAQREKEDREREE